METGALLPPRDEMVRAFLARDAEYDGTFITAVLTTRIFCRPTCPARKPLVENVVFYPSARAALDAGFRPCQRCSPLDQPGTPPSWLQPLLTLIESDPSRRWKESDLAAMGLRPERVRRWFKSNYGVTFHAYSRARRLGVAVNRLGAGAGVTTAAYDSGYESVSGFSDAVRSLLDDSPARLETSGAVVVERIATPVGPMIVGATDTSLCLLEFADRRMLDTQLRRLRKALGRIITPGSNDVTAEASAQLEAYFERKLVRFTIPLELTGSDFQISVWKRLQEIPFGRTVSYAYLAAAIGRPTATRAVARANGDNKLAIVVPCHRVIGSDGTLTGYGGGLWRKQRLLELEGSLTATLFG